MDGERHKVDPWRVLEVTLPFRENSNKAAQRLLVCSPWFLLVMLHQAPPRGSWP